MIQPNNTVCMQVATVTATGNGYSFAYYSYTDFLHGPFKVKHTSLQHLCGKSPLSGFQPKYRHSLHLVRELAHHPGWNVKDGHTSFSLLHVAKHTWQEHWALWSVRMLISWKPWWNIHAGLCMRAITKSALVCCLSLRVPHTEWLPSVRRKCCRWRSCFSFSETESMGTNKHLDDHLFYT